MCGIFIYIYRHMQIDSIDMIIYIYLIVVTQYHTHKPPSHSPFSIPVRLHPPQPRQTPLCLRQMTHHRRRLFFFCGANLTRLFSFLAYPPGNYCNISRTKVCLKMIFHFPRWDMLKGMLRSFFCRATVPPFMRNKYQSFAMHHCWQRFLTSLVKPIAKGLRSPIPDDCRKRNCLRK